MFRSIFDFRGSSWMEYRRLSIQNDATAKCLAYYRFQSSLRDRETLCLINMSVGINIGLSDGYGPVMATGLHPEFGHSYPEKNSVDLGERRQADKYQGCPAHLTCFEGLASAERIRGQWGGAQRSDLPEISHRSPAWHVISDYAGQLCWSVALATAPDEIILTGPSVNEHLIKLVREEFYSRNCGPVPGSRPYLSYDPERIKMPEALPMEPKGFQEVDGLMGALELARRRWLRSEHRLG